VPLRLCFQLKKRRCKASFPLDFRFNIHVVRIDRLFLLLAFLATPTTMFQDRMDVDVGSLSAIYRRASSIEWYQASLAPTGDSSQKMHWIWSPGPAPCTLELPFLLISIFSSRAVKASGNRSYPVVESALVSRHTKRLHRE